MLSAEPSFVCGDSADHQGVSTVPRGRSLPVQQGGRVANFPEGCRGAYATPLLLFGCCLAL